ncbi:hypothetical protein M3Y99_01531200 [Aphelenchoides fujianensis]|nr:hypothetical protein M3Y99_01531200 [Aphelenchoides fujianensis]
MRSVLFVAVAALPHKQPCNPADFKAAQTTFAQKLNLPAADDWQKPLALFAAIQVYYGNNTISGLLDVCNAYNAFLNDLNTRNIDIASCFDPLWLINNDDTPDDAITFAGVSGYLRFHRRRAMEVRGRGVPHQYSDQLHETVRKAVRDARRDYYNRCSIIKNAELDYKKPFKDHCGSEQIKFFACQSYNNFMGNMYQNCFNECELKLDP